jgi:hypothetical protein
VSISDQILFSTALGVTEASEQLARRLGLGRAVDEGGRIFVVRESPSGKVRTIGGQFSESIFRNSLEEPPEDWSVMDGYTLAWDIDIRPRLEDDRLHLESRALFRDVAAAVDWPAVLMLNVQWLAAGSTPDTGLIEFDPPISPDGDNRERWAAFDVLGR